MSFKISKIFAIPLIFSSFLFDTNNELNKVNANVNNSPANKNDLDLYHGMGVSFLCNATRKGFDLDFPKTLNVASATFASVVSQKHGGKIIEKKKEQTVDIKQVDEHEMIFESSYKDWYILEHTRLVESDNYRFRVIYSWNKNKLKIVENHHEIKIIK